MNLNYFRVILFLLSVSMAVWLSIKEFKNINAGIFFIIGVVFVAVGSYLTNGFGLKNNNLELDGHPLDNELDEEKVNGIQISRIKAQQEINPDFQEAEKQNDVYKFYRLKDYPMLNGEHRNMDDCTIDGSCTIKPSGAQILTEEDEVKVLVSEDQLCHHGKAYNPYLKKADLVGEEKAMLEGFELTGTAIQNDKDDLYNYNMKSVDMILPLNVPYDQEPDERINRMNDLCHNCKVGVCHHGICQSA